MSLCTGLSNATMEAVFLNKVIPRFLKRGDDEAKALSTLINENATAQSKREAESTKNPDQGKVNKAVDSKDKETKKDPQVATGLKRPRPADGPAIPAAKRTASLASTTTAAGKGGLLKRPPSTVAASPAPTTTAGAVKPKGHQVVSKAPANFFAGLQSASKKPGTSLTGAKPKVTGTPEKKTAAPSTSAVRPAFSFAATMANLTRVREPESTSSKPEIKRPPETTEEKAKRLRKEERRKLRVSWKPDATLVDIREFSRDPSEINATNMRDVRNGGKEKEGLMFKQHMEMMDVDEDDDQPMEQTFFEFKSPTAIDFSKVDEKIREINYEPYGGGLLKVNSPEQAVQENREASTLMAVYMVKSDIPPCPREPADPYTGEHLETKSFGIPEEPFFVRRAARLQPQSAPVPAPAPTPTPVVDVQTLLANLQGVLPQVQPQQPVQDSNTALQNLLAQTSSNSYTYNAPQPQAATFPDPNQNQAVTNPNSIEAILAQLGAHSQPQAQQPASVPVLQFQPSATTSAPTDANALLAALLNQTQLNAYQAQQPSIATPDQFDQAKGKRQRDGASQPYGNNEQNGGKRQKWNNANKHSNNNTQNGGEHKGPKFIYTCKFWAKNECKKGKDCTYKHE
jgi:hypothetical protein